MSLSWSFFALFVFAVFWFVSTPVYFLTTVLEWVERELNKRLNNG